MTFDYWCIVVAFILPYILIIFAKVGTHFDNRAPRAFMEKISGWKKRAYWAHLNGFEAFAPFAAAVIIAHQLQVSSTLLYPCAAIFIIARILYGIFYIIDKSTLRSVAWFIGFGMVISLFVAAARI